MDLNKVVDERLAADSDFQTRVKDLADDERNGEIAKRRSEIANEEFGKASKIASDQKIRAENAEKDRDTFKNDPRLKPADEPKKDEISADDMYLMASRQVHPEDIAEIKRLAKIGKDGKEMTIKETLDDPTAVAVIARRIDVRKTAGAADKGGGRSAPTGQSDAEFLADVNQRGIIPKPGTPEAERLFWIQRGGKPAGK